MIHMKSIYILAGIVALGIVTNVNAQDYTPTSSGYSPSITEDTTTMVRMETDNDTEGIETIFNTPVALTKSGGCSLIQNSNSDMKVSYKKNGYKMVTDNQDEVIDVKNKNNGDKKLTYYNDYENLKFHQEKSGKTHYKYSYYNECKKVKVKKNKKGITSVTNKAGGDLSEVQANVKSAIQRGANTCASNKYSK
jgi:hypothetical protein